MKLTNTAQYTGGFIGGVHVFLCSGGSAFSRHTDKVSVCPPGDVRHVGYNLSCSVTSQFRMVGLIFIFRL